MQINTFLNFCNSTFINVDKKNSPEYYSETSLMLHYQKNILLANILGPKTISSNPPSATNNNNQ